MRKNVIKSNSGITLIALVITIIILLILAGVAISSLTGNGLFGKTEIAKQKVRYSNAKETVEVKLMEIQIDCIGRSEKYNIIQVAEAMEKAEDITIEKYYNGETASIKHGVTKNTTNLEGIVVSVDEYSEYKFLIGEDCQVIGVLEGKVSNTTAKEDFLDIEEFETKSFGSKVETDNIELSYEKKQIEDNKIQLVITIKDEENGIDKIEYPNGDKLDCNGEKEITINYTIENELEYIFKITSQNGYVKEIPICEGAETLVLLSYSIDNNQKAKLEFYNEKGIKSIEKPDGTVINGKGKKEVYIDYAISNTNENFKITLINNSQIISNLKINEDEREFTNIKVNYENEESTDKTYYRIGNSEKWYEYKDIIKLDMTSIENTTSSTGNQGNTIIHVKKESVNGDIVTADKEIQINSTAYSVLSNIRYKGESCDKYITSTTPSNEFYQVKNNIDNYLIYELGYGHDGGSGNYIATYKLDYSKLQLRTANKLKVTFNHRTYSSSDSVITSTKIYYTDGTSSEEKTSEFEFYDNWMTYTTGTRTRNSVILDLEENKTVDYIEMKINGYDSDNGNFFACIRDIILFGASK